MPEFFGWHPQLTLLVSALRVDTAAGATRNRSVCGAADRLSALSPQDDEINHQSQMVEKLKEQMLDQEEVGDLCFLPLHPFCRQRLQIAWPV